MGLVQHNVVIATTSNPERIRNLREWVIKQEIHLLESPITANGTVTFVLYPDGGKHGGDISADGDERRGRLTLYLESEAWSWVEIQYGETKTRITRGS